MAVAHLVQVDAHRVCGAQPLARRTAKWRCGAVLFIAHVPTVVVAVAQPAQWDALLVGTLEVVRLAGDGRAGVVLVGSIFTVRVAVALPIARYAETVALALELIVVAESRTSGGWKGRRHLKKKKDCNAHKFSSSKKLEWLIYVANYFSL